MCERDKERERETERERKGGWGGENTAKDGRPPHAGGHVALFPLIPAGWVGGGGCSGELIVPTRSRLLPTLKPDPVPALGLGWSRGGRGDTSLHLSCEVYSVHSHDGRTPPEHLPIYRRPGENSRFQSKPALAFKKSKIRERERRPGGWTSSRINPF